MFEKLRIIFSIPELRKKVMLTIGLLAVYRIGFHIPLPMIATNLADTGGTAAEFFERITVFAASEFGSEYAGVANDIAEKWAERDLPSTLNWAIGLTDETSRRDG